MSFLAASGKLPAGLILSGGGARGLPGRRTAGAEEPSSYKMPGHIKNGVFVDALDNGLDMLKRMNRVASNRRGGPIRRSGDRSDPVDFLEV